jgi:hypothetical protein
MTADIRAIHALKGAKKQFVLKMPVCRMYIFQKLPIPALSACAPQRLCTACFLLIPCEKHKEELAMKMALTVWEDRISPVADSSLQLLVVHLANQTITDRWLENFEDDNPFYRARKLSELKVDTFICGAVSSFFANLVAGYGIRVIPFICGEIDAVLNAYLTRTLSGSAYTMRGCTTE